MQHLRDLSRQVMNTYETLSLTFTDYQQRSGLHCVAGCGMCCNNPEIETSVAEMLPLAFQLFDAGKADQMLNVLSNSNHFSCHLFQRHTLNGSKGKCLAYTTRPSICRMFGAAGYSDKNDKTTLSVCKVIKKEQAKNYSEALIKIHDMPPPKLTDGRAQISQLSYHLGTQLYPINQALSYALDRILTLAYYQAQEEGCSVA